MVKNPNWQEADQLAPIYRRGRGIELRDTEKLAGRDLRISSPAPKPTRPRCLLIFLVVIFKNNASYNGANT